MIIIKKKFMSKIIEEDQRAASLIPIYSYDKSSDIFLGDDKSLIRSVSIGFSIRNILKAL